MPFSLSLNAGHGRSLGLRRGLCLASSVHSHAVYHPGPGRKGHSSVFGAAVWGSRQERGSPATNVSLVGSAAKLLARVACSAAVSSCPGEAGGKLAVFTTSIVERFSHPNKIEAQERKKERKKKKKVGGECTPKSFKQPRPQSRHCPGQMISVAWGLLLVPGRSHGQPTAGLLKQPGAWCLTAQSSHVAWDSLLGSFSL